MASKENQEALNWICEYCTEHSTCNHKLGCAVKNTLQEAIDKLESQSDYFSYQDLKAEYEQKISVLEKVIDKACEKLNVEFGYEHESWKEYLLESENDNESL